MPSWILSKYIETKLETTCFYLRAHWRDPKKTQTVLKSQNALEYHSVYMAIYMRQLSKQ